jgi:4-amino-4-deoxy-L-arabinose transferase-like glycosyltransferase
MNIKRRYWGIFGVAVVFFIFFYLRLYHLGFHDLWYDEAITVSCAQYPWYGWNAPLYYILLHFWIKLFGISEFSLRFPSLIFSFLSIVFVFLLGKKLFNKEIGLYASVIMGLCPFQLWYAQEARDYSMLLFFGTLSTYLLYCALSEGKIKFWSSFILTSILGMYSSYFFIFLVFAQVLYILVFFRQLKLGLGNIIPFLLIAAGSLPYLARFLRKFFTVWRGFWIPQPDLGSLRITVENFILGYNAHFLAYLFADVLVIIFFIAAIVNLNKNKQIKPGIIFCLFLFLGPVILAFIFSKLFFSVYIDRGLIIATPYFYLILALGIVLIDRKLIKLFSVVILCGLLFYGIVAYHSDWIFTPFKHHTGTYIKKPVRPLTEFIENNLDPDDIFAFSNYCLMPSFSFYAKRKIPIYHFYDPKLLEASWKRPFRESKFCIPLDKIDNLRFKTLWLVASNWARDGELCENSTAVKEWLDNNFNLKFCKEFHGSWIFTYER